jgi:chromate transporter
MFVFGSGFAIIPYLHKGVVDQFHWITEQEFLDAVSVAMITPGPTTIAVTFIGYLIAGTKGAFLATIAVFFPSYLLVITIAPYYRRVADNNVVKSFMKGATSAATGAIIGATILLAKNTLADLPAILIAAGTFGLLLLPLRIPEPLVIVAAGSLGLLLKGF